MVFFKDFGKTVTDLFKNDKYAFNRKLTMKVKNTDTEWSTEHELMDSGAMKAKLTYVHKDPSIGSFEAKIPTKGDLEFDWSTPKMVDGLKTNIVLKQPSVDVKCKLKQGILEGKVEGSFNMDKVALGSVYASAALGFDGLTCGGAVKVKPGSDNVLADYNIGLHYAKSKNTSISVKTESKVDRINTMLWHRYSDKAELGARYQLDLETPGSPTFDVGYRYKIDDKGTIQGVLRTSGETMFLYKHKLTDRLTASLGCVCDLRSFSAEGTQMHYKMDFEA